MGAQKLLQQTETSNYRFNLYSFCYATMSAAATNRGIQGDERASVMFLARSCGMNWISKEFVESLSGSKVFNSQFHFLKSMTSKEKIFFTACIKQLIKSDEKADQKEIHRLNNFGIHMGFSPSQWEDIGPKVEKIITYYAKHNKESSPINNLNIRNRIPALLTLIELAVADNQQDPKEHKILQHAMKSIKANDRYARLYLPEIYASGLAFFIEMYLRKDKPLKGFSDGVLKYLVQYLSKDHFNHLQKFLLLTNCVHILGLSNPEYLKDDQALKILSLIFELDQNQTNEFFDVIEAIKTGQDIAVTRSILMHSLKAYTRIDSQLTKTNSFDSEFSEAISFLSSQNFVNSFTEDEKKKLVQRTFITMSTGGDLSYEEIKVFYKYLDSALRLNIDADEDLIKVRNYSDLQPLAKYVVDELQKIKEVDRSLKDFKSDERSQTYIRAQRKAFKPVDEAEYTFHKAMAPVIDKIRNQREKEDADFLARRHRLNSNYDFMVKNQKKAGPELKAEFAKEIALLEAEVANVKQKREIEDFNLQAKVKEHQINIEILTIKSKEQTGENFRLDLANKKSKLESEYDEFDDKLVFMDELLGKSDSYQEEERTAFLFSLEDVPKKKRFGIF